MGKIIAIALNTFKEAVRNKILYFLLIFALLILGFSGAISDLSIAAPEKLIKDLGLFAIDFFGFLIAVFVGIFLVYNEIDKRTVYTIVSKPIDRYQFIMGKYLGLLITVLVNMIIMSIFFFAVLYFREATAPEKLTKYLYHEVSTGKWEPTMNPQLGYYLFHAKAFLFALGKAVVTLFGYTEPLTQGLLRVIAMSALGMGIITAFAIFYSTFSTPTLAAVFTFLTFIIGSLNEDILRYADKLAERAGGIAHLTGPDVIKYWFAWVAMHITPNLGLFDKRMDAIYGSELTNPLNLAVTVDWVAVVYGLTYIVAVLCLASMIFNKRNFR